MPIYCGNNAKHKKLTSGSHIIGTRYACMKKGIGVGMNLPVDGDFIKEYEPIDITKIFCGGGNKLPDGYDRIGSTSECLRKGVGIGKKVKATRGKVLNPNTGRWVIKTGRIGRSILKSNNFG
jgi:hypothetical protein